MSAPTPFVPGARAAFTLGIETTLASRRAWLTGLLLGLPALLAVAYRVAAASGVELHLTGWQVYGDFAVTLYWVGLALPLVALLQSSGYAEEVEARTIVYLLTRPVSRASLLVGRFAAYFVFALGVTLAAQLATFLLLASQEGAGAFFGRVPGLVRDAGVLALALLAYGALFTLLGVLLRRPLLPGLGFLFGWELLANLPGYLPRLTVARHLRGLLPYAPPVEGLFGLFTPLPVSGWACLLSLALVIGGGLTLATLVFERREYVLPQ